MRTEQDALQIIDVILSADELLRTGKFLMNMIENAIVSASYSFDNDEDDFDQEVIFVSAFKGSTKDLADSILTGDLVSTQELQGLSNLAKKLSSELTELSEGDTYIGLASQGPSNLESNLDTLLTASNRFFESFDSLEFENKIALDSLIAKGVKVVAKELLKSEDLDSRIPVLISFFEDVESVAPPALEEPEVVEEEVAEPDVEAPDLEKILQREGEEPAQGDPIGLPAREFLLRSQLIAKIISDNTEDLLDAYDLFERTNRDKVISLFSSKKTGGESSFDGEYTTTNVDRIQNNLSNPNFSRLVYEKIEGLDDNDSFYEDVKSGKKDFLSIEGSIFSGKFADILGANIIESDSDNSAVVEIDDKRLKDIRALILREVQIISTISNDLYSSALTLQAPEKDVSAKINLYRRFLIRKFDYLISSIKLRDRAILSYLKEDRLLTPDQKNDIKRNCLGSNVFSGNGLFFQVDKYYDELLAALVPLYKPAASNNIFKNKRQKRHEREGINWQKTLDTPFEELLVSKIKKIIEEHLGEKKFSSDENVSKEILNLSITVIVQELRGMVFYKAQLSKVQSKCSVCNKFVYIRNDPKQSAGFPAEQYALLKRKVENPEKDITYNIYSLVRKDGSAISFEALVNSEFELSEEEFDKLVQISKDFGRPDDSVVRVKSWEQIGLDFYSGDSFKNIESIIRKSDAIRSLGGKRLRSGVKISTSKNRCPFGGSKDLINKFKTQGVAGPGSEYVPGEAHIEGASASGYIATQEDLDKMTIVEANNDSPWECGFKEDFQQVTGLNIYLEEMVGSAITPEIKESILNLSRRQSAGGFKFSSRSFICPEKITVPSDLKQAKQVIKDYSIIAMPIAEPEYSEVHPIIKMLKENKSFVNLYCGARTSISQFNRIKFGEIIKQLVEDKSEESYNGVINSMIELGVEVSDILPFTMLKHSNLELGESNIELDSSVVDDLLARSYKISQLLKKAMATKTTGIGEGQVSVHKFFDFIQNIELTCHNGHSFSINDSINFANNYIDVPDLRTKDRLNATRKVLNESSLDQLSLLLKIKNGPISTISRKRAEEMGMKSYSEFDFGKDPISSIYFENPDDPEGDYLYINSGNALSIYPMKTRFMTAVADTSSKSESTTYLQKDIGGMATSSGAMMSDSSEGGSVDWLENNVGSTTTTTDRERGEAVSKKRQEYVNNINKTNAIIVALAQNAIISIQELLLASTRSSKEDVVFYGKALDKTLKEKINSDFFNERLTNLLKSIMEQEFVFSRARKVNFSKDYDISIDELSGLIKDSIINDFGEDPRAFIYAIGSSFHRYLQRKIVEGAILYANNHPDPGIREDLKDDIEEVLVHEKKLTVSQISKAMPSFFDPREIAEFEKSIDPKGQNTEPIQGVSERISQVDQGAGMKVVNITELWFAKQATIAATAMYLAERLSEVYNRFLSESSSSYVNLPILDQFDLSTRDKVIAITIDRIITSGQGTSLDLSDIDDLDLNDHLDSLGEVVRNLTRLQVGAAYASRANYYQELGLDYIKNIYMSLTYSPAMSHQEKVHVNNILQKVIVNTRSTEIILEPHIKETNTGGKYAEYFSRFENAHSLMPSASHPTLSINPKTLGGFVSYKTKTVKPIYLIKQGAQDFSYILGIEGYLISAPSFAILVSKDDEELLSSLLPVQPSVEFPESHPDYFENGWTLMVGNIKGSDVKKAGFKTNTDLTNSVTMISICNHPGTEVVLDESKNPVSYRNVSLGLDTETALSLGSYKASAPANSYYPPVDGFTSRIGVPIPVEVGAKKGDINISLSDMPIDIPAGSNTMVRVNLSDLLQRNPPDEAESILLSIERVYADFVVKYKQLKSISEKEAEKKKKQTSLTMRSLMNRYRNLPLKIDTSGSTRTVMTGKGGFQESQGWYVPIISPVLANLIITKACFGIEYAGHGVFSEDLYESEEVLSAAKTAMQSFLAKINGYDELASLFNQREDMVNGEPVSGMDLLEPYEMLFRQRLINGQQVSRVNMNRLFGPKGVLRVISRSELNEHLETLKSEEEKAAYIAEQGVVYNERLRRIESIRLDSVDQKYKTMFKEQDGGILRRWSTYTPKFYPINVSKSNSSNVANFGVPKLVIDTPMFRKKKVDRDLSRVRDEAIGSDILSTDDLATIYKQRRGKKPGGIYYFSEVLQTFFDKKFYGIRKLVEEYGAAGIFKDAYFDSAELFNKVSSKIICSDFIKKSEKYKTDVFGRIMIKSEALMRLFD